MRLKKGIIFEDKKKALESSLQSRKVFYGTLQLIRNVVELKKENERLEEAWEDLERHLGSREKFSIKAVELVSFDALRKILYQIKETKKMRVLLSLQRSLDEKTEPNDPLQNRKKVLKRVGALNQMQRR